MNKMDKNYFNKKSLSVHIVETYKKMQKNSIYKVFLWIGGFITLLLVKIKSGNFVDEEKRKSIQAIKDELDRDNAYENFLCDCRDQEKRRREFFEESISDEEIEKKSKNYAMELYEQAVLEKLEKEGISTSKNSNFHLNFQHMLENKLFFIMSLILSFPMYMLIGIYKHAYVKYIFERLIMLCFVIIGVTFLVFSILYISPSDPAANILGMEATQEQIDNFNRVYGLNKPYTEQLINTFKKLFTFDLGKEYSGNTDIASTIARKFPITFKLTLASMAVSLIIAIPAGIISSMKQYSSIDYIFMLVALIGLSIPNFWLGLVLILKFSIELKWLPATFQIDNLMTLILPAIVLGTGMAASVARMVRSSMLEVKSQDYITTARAKGLDERRVVLKHILTNALIPIVTVIGLQFGGMLGGSSATEKVFNVNGLGTYIVDKQFLPDTPAILAGVVYMSIVISIVNLAIDILYTFIDPRIKTKLKDY